MALSSSRKMNAFVIFAFLTVAFLTDHSHGIMGWFGNGGKRPEGRRSFITPEERWNLAEYERALNRHHHDVDRQHVLPRLERHHRHPLSVLREKSTKNTGL